MIEFKVKKGVGIELRDYHNYPFEEMEVGDFFLVDSLKASVDNARYAASWYGKREKKKFSVRKLKDGEFRCWRMA